LRDLRLLKHQQKNSDLPFRFGNPYPCLLDKFTESGETKGHYFHQDLLVANRIFLNQPEKHVDVGSRMDGFVAHVASFRKIEVLDIRPLTDNINNISFTQADMMKPVDKGLNDYCDSLSCLHALEHFGLGRYGDPVRHDGYLHGLNNIHRILKVGGKLYISVPIGMQRIEFNAHRVFSLVYLLGLFEDRYRIDRFSYVDDDGDLYEDIAMTVDEINNNFNCNYGCGIFELTKI
jgi:SAM-dependent methyltransferase